MQRLRIIVEFEVMVSVIFVFKMFVVFIIILWGLGGETGPELYCIARLYGLKKERGRHGEPLPLILALSGET